MLRISTIIALLVIITGHLNAARAEGEAVDPAVVNQFDSRYGDKITAAKSTRGGADDAQVALLILSDLAKNAPAKALAKYSCEKAYEQGMMDPSGYNYAILAMQYMKKVDPASNFAARRKIQRVYMIYYEHGKRTKDPKAPTAEGVIAQYTQWANDLIDAKQYDEAVKIFKEAAGFAGNARLPEQRLLIQKRLKEIDSIIERDKRVTDLEATLKTDPENQDARKTLIDIFLIEMDSPAKALPHANNSTDETVKGNVTLAAGDVKKLNAADSLKLAKWYETKGNNPSSKNRIAMLVRAKMYYEEFQSKHGKRDGQYDTVTKTKRAVEKSLLKLGVGTKLARRKVMKLRGEKAKGNVSPEIERAIDRAVAWLYTQQDRVTNWDGQGRNNANNFGGYTALVTYALLMAEEDPQIKDALNRAVRWTFQQNLNSVYAVCFRAHMWEVLPDSEFFDRVVRSDADRLVRIVNRKGLYHYTLKNTDNGDLSTTLAGFLALWLAEISGVEVDDAPWQLISKRLIQIQRADGGWAYKNDNNQKTKGSMTAAGLTILLMALDQDHLTEAQTELANRAIKRGLEWFDQNFSASSNPGGGWFCYYLVALQHVGVLSGRSEFKNMNWYDSAAEHLVKTQQPDGSWGDLAETALAVIFLSRGGIYIDEPSQADQPAANQPAAAATP